MNDIIMVVDDSKANIYMLANILKGEYKVIPATSGESALKLLDYKKPDLVLLDVSMPGIDGFAVLRYMKSRADLSNIPVIFVTGEYDDNTEEKGLLLGAVDYIRKPYNAAVVKAKVQNHLDLKRYRDALEVLVHKRTEQLSERTKQLEKRTSQLIASHEAIIMGMSLMSECHDKVTGKHIERIKKFTEMLVYALLETAPDKITEDLGKQIILFSPLHDVGKIGISDSILKKNDVLTHDEFNIMKSHTVGGAELLEQTEMFLADGKEVGDLGVAIEIAKCHHEKFDGTGYPEGLKGDEIPISARIVAIADVYDALRSIRPYKQAFSHEEAVAKMIKGDGRTDFRHFDPAILQAFIAINDKFDAAWKAAL